jgi:flagellar hook-associated protein 3 FlgL
MRVTSFTQSRHILDDVTRANAKLTRTQSQLSSGKQLTRVSDDPYAVGRALQLHTEMEQTQQLQKNVGEAQGWSEVTDGALNSIATAVQRVRDLVIQGATDTSGGSPRLRIATEVRGLIDSIKSSANTTYSGRYVFSGTDTDTAPYAVGGSDAYAAANEDPVVREIGPNVTMKVNVSGKEVLGDDTGGLLFTLRGVLNDLETDNGAGLRTRIPALDTSLDNLNGVRAQIGANYNRLDVATARLAEFEGTTLQLLSNVEDTDMAKAMIDFSTQQAALQAGLQAGSKIVQNSLLDFLR